MKVIAFLVGAIAGVLIVRAIFLDPLQVMGWNLFWNSLSDGELMNPEVVFKSQTFMKCVVGFAIGGILGAWAGAAVQKALQHGQTGKA